MPRRAVARIENLTLIMVVVMLWFDAEAIRKKSPTSKYG